MPGKKDAPKIDSSELKELTEKLLTACHILDHEGITDGYGHISARVPGADDVLDGGTRWLFCVGGPSDQEKDDADGCKEHGQLNGKLFSCGLHLSLLIGPAWLLDDIRSYRTCVRYCTERLFDVKIPNRCLVVEIGRARIRTSVRGGVRCSQRDSNRFSNT